MVKILIKEDFSQMMLDLDDNLGLFKIHAGVIAPHKKTILENWVQEYHKHFGEDKALKKNCKPVLEKWLNLLFKALDTGDLKTHYSEMVAFGREIADMEISLEEIIFSLHFLEEVTMPLLIKHYPEKKDMTRVVFALDMLFHNELACLSLAHFNHYRNEIIRLEKMKDNLTHMIIHDIKNPANIVSTAARSLMNEIESVGSINDSQYLGIIAKSAESIWSMINNLLDINRMENGKMAIHKTLHRLDEVLDEGIKDIKPGLDDKNVKIEQSVNKTPPFMFDRDIIKRVITNLLDNALKFSPHGGTITVSIKEEKGEAAVSFRDRGPGIKKDDMERIFEKFGQSGLAAEGKIHGTGLGLTFCRMAIEASGGSIRAESASPGSVFSFRLPLS